MEVRTLSALSLPLLITAAVLCCDARLDGQAHARRLSVPDDPTVKDQLARAQTAVGVGDLDRALSIWQGLLDGKSDRVVATWREDGSDSGDRSGPAIGDVYGGIRPHVMSLLRALSSEDLGRYVELNEPRAGKLLARGLEESDERLLMECLRRYGLTTSGRRAHMALVDLLLESGRFEEARVTSQRLGGEETHANPEVVARQAWALWGSRRTDDLSGLTARVKARQDEPEITVGGEAVKLVEFVQGLSSPASNDNAGGVGGLDLSERRRWRASFSKHEGDSWGWGERETVTGYPVVPAVSDGALYACDGTALFGLDLNTGKKLWNAVRTPYATFENSYNQELEYHVTMDDDLVFGYLINEPLLHSYWRRYGAVGSHKLIAVERATGKTRWTHDEFAGKDPRETAFLKDLSINQPPVVVGDTLYAAGTVLKGIFHHWVCAFERDTGRLKWRTYTGAGQTTLSRGGNPRVACVPGYMTEDEGVLYYGTNMGVLCAVDGLTGAILWQCVYPQEELPDYGSRWRRRYAPRRAPCWRPTKPVVHEDTVFFTASDSPSLYAVHKETGALSLVMDGSRDEQVRNKIMTSGDDEVLLVISRQLTAIDMERRMARWSSNIIRDSSFSTGPRGRGGVTDGHVVLTTGTGPSPGVHRVRLADGRTVDSHGFASPPASGHVTVNPAAIVITGSDFITAYVR